MKDQYPPIEAARSASVLSIGALSKATGVPTDTLRTWERRYGFPHPLDRAGSGHRRYPIGTVEKIRLVVKALELGHKPSVALRADVETLRRLLRIHDEPEVDRSPTEPFVDGDLDEWFSHVEAFDGRALAHALGRAWTQLGAMGFVERCLAPFVTQLGDRWSDGRLLVAHEHFASEHLREFLSARWRSLSSGAKGPRIVCAAPPGEEHVIGLHMAALVIALADGRVVFLGANTPVEDIARAVADNDAHAVALSASVAADKADLTRCVKRLRRAIDSSTPIVVGGGGFGRVVGDVVHKPGLDDLREWVGQIDCA